MRIRHYWQSTKKRCDCGSTNRIWFLHHWICYKKLQEEFEKQGYRLEEIDPDQKANFDKVGNLI